LVRFAQTLLPARLTPSVGTVGDALDNALAETTVGLYGGGFAAAHLRDAPRRLRGRSSGLQGAAYRAGARQPWQAALDP
jgi:hypothetical protein